MYQVLVGIVLACMLIQFGESAASNCRINDCTCNKKTINVHKPGEPVANFDVCCPPAPIGSVPCSKYLRAGNATANRGAFCTCDFIRVRGQCLRGEQCSPLHRIKGSLNGMPICCRRASDKLTVIPKRSKNRIYYSCECAPPTPPEPFTGDCWQGSQCDSCDPGYVGGVNGYKLCCANCQKKGLIIDAGARSCNCNN